MPNLNDKQTDNVLYMSWRDTEQDLWVAITKEIPSLDELLNRAVFPASFSGLQSCGNGGGGGGEVQTSTSSMSRPPIDSYWKQSSEDYVTRGY